MSHTTLAQGQSGAVSLIDTIRDAERQDHARSAAKPKILWFGWNDDFQMWEVETTFGAFCVVGLAGIEHFMQKYFGHQS